MNILKWGSSRMISVACKDQTIVKRKAQPDAYIDAEAQHESGRGN